MLDEFKKTDSYKFSTSCQKAFFEAFFGGKNICLSGQAGTGKSWSVDAICKFLDSKGIYAAKTALTGVAAVNIGGLTIHSFAGVGLAEGSADEIIREIRKKKSSKAPKRIRSVKVLFIDEISMASASFLDKLDEVFRVFRYDSRPFGGVQLVMIGDFLQLPPVFKAGFGEYKKDGFAFESQFWNNNDIQVIHLKEIVRQKDKTFSDLLNRIRVGDVSDLSPLLSRVGAKVDAPSDIKPVQMYCRNVDVDLANARELTGLPGLIQHFHSTTDGGEHYEKFFDKNCIAPKVLSLKKGAQVMLLTNEFFDEGLINGSIGVVTDFSSVGPAVKFKNGAVKIIKKHNWEIKEKRSAGINEETKEEKYENSVVAVRKQIPLKLAWACTVHKTQGQTLDYVHADISEAFEYGQAYTALSRVRNLDDLILNPFEPKAIRANPKCLQFYKKCEIVVKKEEKVGAIL